MVLVVEFVEVDVVVVVMVVGDSGMVVVSGAGCDVMVWRRPLKRLRR